MKKLEQIRQESKEIKDKIDDKEERLRQLKNQEKKILKQDIVKRRKERTHRLITRRPILESLIENAEELTDEEIKILLDIFLFVLHYQICWLRQHIEMYEQKQ